MSSPQTSQAAPVTRPRPVTFAALPWIFLLLAVGLQIRTGSKLLPGDLADADPPAHFTTGVLVHDFLLHGWRHAPLPFAKCFYVRYPKVAFGHWPPIFYVMEAAFFLLFGTRIVVAKCMCAAIAFACAGLLYRRCRMYWEQWYALLAAAVFLALPLVQKQAWRIMSDLLLAFFILLAIGALADYLIRQRRREAFFLALWSTFAILTKATGWLILLPIVASPLLTGRRSLYRAPAFWTTVTAIAALGAPFFLLMNVLHLGYPPKLPGHLHRLRVIFSNLTIGQIAIGCVGLILLVYLWRLLPKKELNEGLTASTLCMLWIATQVLFILTIPLTPELHRFFIPALAPALLLLMGALLWIERRLLARNFPWARACYGLGAAFGFASCVALPLVSTSAYSQAVRSIPVEPKIILVQSDASGEGALIAARLVQDRSRSSYVLRASKFLASSEWSGARYSLRYQDAAGVRDALESIPVEYVIFDTSAHAAPHALLLAAALQEPGWKWDVVARAPVSMGPRQGVVTIYHRELLAQSGHAAISVQLEPGRASQWITCPSLEWEDEAAGNLQ